MYLPEFKGPVEGYVVNFLRGKMWRVSATHTREEMMQEAYIVFLRCAARYAARVENGAHFMSLFKTAWNNEFNDISQRATVAREPISENVLTDEGDVEALDSVGDLDNDGSLAVMIKQAPKEVILVLTLFLVAPQEVVNLAMESWRSSGKYRADGDKAISRMLGLPEGSTPMTDVKEYFSPN